MKVPVFRWLLFAVMAIAFAAAWVVAFSFTQRTLPWLALLAALDAVIALRILGLPRGVPGAIAGGMFVVVAVVLANFGMAAISVGGPAGFGLLDSLARISPALAWELVRLANDLPQLLLYVVAAELAAWWGHRS